MKRAQFQIILSFATRDSADGSWRGHAMVWRLRGDEADKQAAIDFARAHGYDVRTYDLNDKEAFAKAKRCAAADAQDRSNPLCVVCAAPLKDTQSNACGMCYGSTPARGGRQVGVREVE